MFFLRYFYPMPDFSRSSPLQRWLVPAFFGVVLVLGLVLLRDYALSVDGRTWLLDGETERARTVFNADGKTQTITWEWLRDGKWLPLCDRVASRVDTTLSATKRIS